MSLLVEPPIRSATMVGMGQIAAARAPGCLTSVLGSCVGVAIYHPDSRTGALAHVVLPESLGRDGPAAKFADTAVPNLLSELESLGAPARGLVAKIAGGACMFGANGPLRIGETNIEAVLAALARHGLRLAGRDTGGDKGRKVVFNLQTGELRVEIAGQTTRSF